MHSNSFVTVLCGQVASRCRWVGVCSTAYGWETISMVFPMSRWDPSLSCSLDKEAAQHSTPLHQNWCNPDLLTSGLAPVPLISCLHSGKNQESRVCISQVFTEDKLPIDALYITATQRNRGMMHLAVMRVVYQLMVLLGWD